MASTVSLSSLAYKIFVFNPQIVEVVQHLAKGSYEWSWILVMFLALGVWNAKLWNYFRSEKEKYPFAIFRIFMESIAHWSFTNVFLYSSIRMHQVLYGISLTYSTKSKSNSGSAEKQGLLMETLSKITLTKPVIADTTGHSTVLPLAVMMIVSHAVLILGILLKLKKTHRRKL